MWHLYSSAKVLLGAECQGEMDTNMHVEHAKSIVDRRNGSSKNSS